jgi:hypothetical protein
MAMLLKAIAVEADGLFFSRADNAAAAEDVEIDQLMPIVAETEQFPNRAGAAAGSQSCQSTDILPN